MFPQYLKCKSKMLLMLSFQARKDKDIIDEDDHELVQIWTEDPVHQVHEHNRCICQSKWHDKELKRPISSQESDFQDINIFNSQLIVTQTKINLQKVSSSLQLIKQIINPR